MSRALSNELVNLDTTVAVTQAVIIAKQLGLSPFLTWMQENNPAADLPYHNSMHQILVAVMAHRLYTMSQQHYLAPLDDSTLPALFLAGLFHDFNHSGGVETDDINIRRALDGLAAAVVDLTDTSKPFDQVVVSIPSEIYKKAKCFIQATEWPWKPFPLDDSTRGFDYLRDADILASSMVAGLCAPIHGLPQELKHKLNGNVLTPLEMAAGQREFLSTVKLNTLEGMVLWENSWPVIQRAQQALAEAM